jgi:hypothetical protein
MGELTIDFIRSCPFSLCRCGRCQQATTGPEIVKGDCGDFHRRRHPENFFHEFSAPVLFTVSADYRPSAEMNRLTYFSSDAGLNFLQFLQASIRKIFLNFMDHTHKAHFN